MVTVKSFFALAAFFLSAPLMVAASPLPGPQFLINLPQGTSRLGVDEGSDTLTAYDASGRKLATVSIHAGGPKKRANGPCTDLSVEDAKKLPGWKAMEDSANKSWGTGSRNVVTNDKDFNNYPAQVCVDSAPVVIQPQGNPQCSTSKQSTDGQIVGSEGSITLAYSHGTSSSSSTTVTKESSVAVGVTVSAGFSLGKLLDLGTGVTTETAFQNTLSNTQTSSNNDTQSASITMKAPAGKKCHLDFNNKACTGKGTGKVRFTATGWVWFEYDNKVDGHYKWAVNLDSTIPNVDDRSSFAEFQTTTQSVMKTDFHGNCDEKSK